MPLSTRKILFSGSNSGTVPRATRALLAAAPYWFDVQDLSSMKQEITGASASTAVVVGGPVGSRFNKGTAGGWATAPSNAARPLLGQNPNNGRYFLLYDGVDDCYNMSAWALTANTTVYSLFFRPYSYISSSVCQGFSSEDSTFYSGEWDSNDVVYVALDSPTYLSTPSTRASNGAYVFLVSRRNDLDKSLRINSLLESAAAAGNILGANFSFTLIGKDASVPKFSSSREYGLIGFNAYHSDNSAELIALEKYAIDILADSNYPYPTPIRRGNGPGLDNFIVADTAYNSLPGLTQLQNGTLVLIYRTATDHSSVDGVLNQRISTDGGHTWSSATKLFDSVASSISVFDCELSTLSNGNVIAIFSAQGPGATQAEVKVMLGTVSGNIISWGAPASIGHAGYDWNWANGKIIELDNGDLLAPTYNGTSANYVTGPWVSTVSRSTNGGASWGSPVTVCAVGQSNETGIVQLSNGTIVAIVRVEGAGYYRSTSADRGATWSVPAQVITASLVGKPALTKLNSSDALLLFPRAPGSGKAITVSLDYGVTWEPFFVVDSGSDVYSSSVVDRFDPGLLHTVLAETTSATIAKIFYQSFQLNFTPKIPFNLQRPIVTQSGYVASVNVGSWSNKPTSYSYAWTVDGVQVGTSSTYTVQLADQGKSLICIVTGTNSVSSSSMPSLAITPPSALALLATAPYWFDVQDLSSMKQEITGASATTAAAVGSPVGSRLNKGTAGGWATAPANGQRPILRQDGSGYYYLEYDGVNDYYNLPASWAMTEKMTFYHAGTRSASGQEVNSFSGGVNNYPAIWYGVDNKFYAALSGDIGGLISSADTSTGSFVLTSWRDTESEAIRKNGTQIATRSINPTITGAFSRIGYFPTSEYNVGHEYSIAGFEVLHTDGSVEQAAIETYMGTLVGLTL